MKPYSKYIFELSETSKSSYLLKEIHGFVFADFPAMYKTGKNKGLQYITFAEPYNANLKKKFNKCLYFGNNYLTGLHFTELNPGKAFGDNKSLGLNDCLLVEHSESSRGLTVYFIKDMADQKEAVFEKWLAGDVLESVDSDLLLLNNKAVNPNN